MCKQPVTLFYFQGLGTADNTLIRIMISRSEIDMLDIRECFRLKYEKSLHNMIKVGDFGGFGSRSAVIVLPSRNMILCVLKPLRTTHREITRGLCLICAEEMTSKFSILLQASAATSWGQQNTVLHVLLSSEECM